MSPVHHLQQRGGRDCNHLNVCLSMVIGNLPLRWKVWLAGRPETGSNPYFILASHCLTTICPVSMSFRAPFNMLYTSQDVACDLRSVSDSDSTVNNSVCSSQLPASHNSGIAGASASSPSSVPSSINSSFNPAFHIVNPA